jgi:hypothetical protein
MAAAVAMHFFKVIFTRADARRDEQMIHARDQNDLLQKIRRHVAGMDASGKDADRVIAVEAVNPTTDEKFKFDPR